ncbi:hypothetical protein [Microbispora sp. H10830]|uniref:hypothetical protein n=1 Tax=Microbispora sp. H10830 TaxID=2729109 RepID=UPI001603056A|nr:hypothetical protein [Microbispora sp. H10830]
MVRVSFVDETTSGERREARHLEISEERTTLREIIRQRILQEVAEHDATRPEIFRGPVQPGDTERTLNGHPVRAPRRVDVEEQFARAVEAFGRNGFLVLIDDRQVQDLDAEVTLRMSTEITFLKLVPLVGG